MSASTSIIGYIIRRHAHAHKGTLTYALILHPTPAFFLTASTNEIEKTCYTL